MDHDRNKWIGLVEVRQLKGVEILGEDRGAYVTSIAWCEEGNQFEATVEKALIELGLVMVRAEEIESVEERLRKFEADAPLAEAIDQVSRLNRVAFLNFHTFPLSSDGSNE